MSLLSKASLVLTPNAYKAGKLYSVVPSDGSGDFTVTRATSATRVNSLGLIETVGINVPRIDYTNASCPSILVEPQRTNLFLRSEEFENASWVKLNTTLMQNSTISPSGDMGADMITSITNSTTLAVQVCTIVSGTTYSTTFYAKQNTQRFIYIRFTSNSSSNHYVSVVFDLQDGTVGQTSVGTTSGTLINATATSVANGFYRITLVASINVTDGNVGIGFAPTKTGNTFNTAGTITFGITNGNSLFLWGAQLELGGNATSYIPTTTAAVTRNADLISRDNIYTNGLITSAGGTLFIEIDNNLALLRNSPSPGIFIGDSIGATNAIRIRNNANFPETIGIDKVIGGVRTGLLATPVGTVKIAITWNGTTANMFINSIKGVTNTAFPIVNMEFLNLNGNDVTKFIKSMMLFPKPLTDSECISLTTL